LKYIFIPIIGVIVALVLYFLFSGRKEEVYGIPVSEGDVWVPLEEKGIEERIEKKRKVPNYRKKEGEIRSILNEIEKPSKEDVEIHKLWNMDPVIEKKRNVQIPTPVVTRVPIQKPEKTEEMKFWKDYMEGNKLKTLEDDLKILEIKEKEYKEKDNKKMVKEISELKKIVKDEIKASEGSYENVS
ncbi:MAG: hypothetical protein KAT49_05945, partial [Methanomicrobia archaeon]|nr:hypothetical protein [Methanomicrobia archaeon]